MMSCFKLSILCLLPAVLPARAAPISPPVQERSITELEQRLESIDSEVEQLAGYSLRSGFGAVGYASYSSKTAEAREWIQINLKQKTSIDQIVLVPTIGRESKSGFQANAFPVKFRILAGSGSDTNGQVVATFGEQDHLLPRIAPLVVPCSITASWIRVEASHLSPRIFDEHYDLKFSEIMVFQGSENIALRKPVQTSSQIKNKFSTQQPRFLTDGFVPYQMDAARGRNSIYFLSTGIDDTARMTIDLGTTQPLNRIHLHSVDPSFTAPLDQQADFYLPREMLIEGAQQPDFSDAETLIKVRYKSPLAVGPILMHRFPKTSCRYVRLTNIDPYIDQRQSIGEQSRIGFAEIELFANGQNVALGKPFEANFVSRRFFPFEALTDGLNFYGQILPVREWMNELALRHDLEVERPLVVAELNQLYARQKTNLNRMRWLAIIALAGIGITIVVDRMIRMRTIIKLRERIAANLHDELSANLHAVALLGEMAQKNIDSKNKLEEVLDRIQQLSKRSRNAARHCTNMLQADTACEDLIRDMKRSSERLLMDMQHELIFEGEPFLRPLSARKRNDLFLFYKECLINIARHSGATSCRTLLTGSSRSIRLEVSDNGSGVTTEPRSLKRRAHLLGARVHLETPENGGTNIILTLRRGWGFYLRKKQKGPRSERPIF